MKFFNARIVTKQVPLGAALKADSKPARTLDEILADVKSKGQVKTAAVEVPQVKTASVEAPVAEAPKAEVKEAKKELPESFKAHQFGKKDDEKGKDEPKKDEKPEDGKKEEKSDKKEDKKEEKASSAPRTIKMAKSLDFRGWEAEDVVKAWGQHGSHEKCVANVKSLVNEPATYCKLLQVASNKAASIVKTAAAKAEVKKASPKGVFKKLAKLSDEETSFLKKYWADLYGQEYVESMMKDY